MKGLGWSVASVLYLVVIWVGNNEALPQHRANEIKCELVDCEEKCNGPWCNECCPINKYPGEDYDGFTKTNHFCFEDGWDGEYDILVEALHACNYSKICQGVHDYKCDGVGSFVKCNGSNNISDEPSKKGTCFYRKEDGCAVGAIVTLDLDEQKVRQSFENSGYGWNDQMKGMLGKEFTVLEIVSSEIIALPSPDGSDGGKWYFPTTVVSKCGDAACSSHDHCPKGYCYDTGYFESGDWNGIFGCSSFPKDCCAENDGDPFDQNPANCPERSECKTEEQPHPTASLPAVTPQHGVNLVICGRHNASTCNECPQGHGESWCHGQCVWDLTTTTCNLKVEKPMLELELEKHDLMDLYEIFLNNGIKHSIMWTLNQDEIEQIGLNLGQQKRYFLAVKEEENTVAMNCASNTIPKIRNPGAIIKSPNYPRDYPISTDCQQIVEFAKGQTVSLTFLNFNLEQAPPTCEHDWLEIRDSDHALAKPIGTKLCGDQIPSSVTSSGNALFLHFHSDHSTTRSGFRIRVDIATPMTTIAPTTTKPAVDCQWSTWRFGACSKTCGGGRRTKTRTKTVIENSSGTCYGAPSTSESCNTQECPDKVDCQWSTWSRWGACSKNCGGGRQTKTRTKRVMENSSGRCYGSPSTSKSCNTKRCRGRHMG